MNKFILIIFSILIFEFSAVAQSKCMISGWVQDKELRKSISIYKVADPMYVATHNDGIVGAIDNSTEQGEQKPVEIIGFKAVDRNYRLIRIRKVTDLNGKVIFEGDGWIEAERVTAKASSTNGNSINLYSQSKSSSKKVGTIPNNTLLTIVGFDCFGLKIKYKGKTGWISRENICGNPATSCS